MSPVDPATMPWMNVQSTVLRWRASKTSPYSMDTGDAPRFSEMGVCAEPPIRIWRPLQSSDSEPGALQAAQ